MESNFSYSFVDLYRDVLDYRGKGRDSTDATAIAKAKRRVNDAYRKYLCLNWEFLSEQAVMKVEVGKDTYELPDNFGTIRVPFKCFPNTSGVSPSEDTVSNIWNLQMYSPQSGDPTRFTFRSIYSPERGIRKSVTFWPTPIREVQYHYEYKIFPNELVEDADIPYCPANMSHVLREFCLAEVELFDEEGAKTAHTINLYNVLLPQAIRDNSIRSPNTVGSLIPQGVIGNIQGNVGIVYGQRFQY